MTPNRRGGSDGQELEALLAYVRDHRGFDFTGYKRTSLERRIRKRMDAVGIPTFGEYLDHLEVHPDEFAQLFNTILINVTTFYRDRPAWDYVTEEVVPRIVEAKPAREPIRVWSAGCASGEEAYTAAMVFADVLGTDGFQRRVKVYATDADEDALAAARQGTYTAKDLEPVPEEQRSKYFEAAGSRFSFRKDLRRCVIFGRHDLVQDAPISRLDLLICRNTLMYFNAETQSRILQNFHFALTDIGFLFLGKAETMLSRGDLFEPVDLRCRVFRKGRTGGAPGVAIVAAPRHETTADRQAQLRDAAIDSGPVAQLLVDPDGALILANGQARTMFDIGANDIGRRLQDLEISYRPLELRSRIEVAYSERRPVTVNSVERPLGDGDVQTFDFTVAPVFDDAGTELGVSIVFSDVTRYRRLRTELERSTQELETAYEELQSTNEELETTNEELQSTVEELETTNEELQSANEELETTNEELQSTNTEIGAVNDELRERSDEIDVMNAFLKSVLASLQVGVIVVDSDLVVQRWNDRAEELWGLRDDEVAGQAFLSLDIGLDVRRLEEPIRRCMTEGPADRPLMLEATNRRGRAITVSVTCSPLTDIRGGVGGAVILIDERNG